MKCIDPGHVYRLDQRGADGGATFTAHFLDLEKKPPVPGPTTQEYLRMLIDRTMYCDQCEPWEGNQHIIDHLRMALALHEARALIKKTVKGEIKPERVALGSDGHFKLISDQPPGDHVLPFQQQHYTHEPSSKAQTAGSIDPPALDRSCRTPPKPRKTETLTGAAEG
jgi:hypothetical protein